MPLISRNCIESIKQQVNIVDVAESYVTLKRTGSSYKGLSPFNPEKTPSFVVHPDKGFFKCFSSGNGGDVFRLVQLLENLDFYEAVENIANRFNIEIQYEEGGPSPETRSLRNQIFEINEQAAAFFHDEFKAESEHGNFIRKYWTEDRKFSMELANEFRIGLAPVNGNKLMTVLKRFPPEALMESGLFYGKQADKLIPRFRGRLMIPIRDIQGRTIAFTARQLEITPQDHDVEKAKYINSPETPVFIKKNMLFNLDKARANINEQPRFVFVEGQLDALRCWEQGIKTAVAPQGSGVSEDQIYLLKRHADSLDCFLDGDNPGQKAALRILPMALKAGIDIRFLPLEAGTDPDDFLVQHGIGGFESLQAEAKSPIEFSVSIILPEASKATSRAKSNAVQKVFEILNNCDSEVACSDYLNELSRCIYIERQSLETDFRRFRNHGRSTEPTIINKSESSSELLTSAENELLLLVLHEDGLGVKISQIIDSEWINKESIHGLLLDRFLAEFREGLWPGTSNLNELLENDEEREIVYTLLGREITNDNFEKSANLAVQAIYKSYHKRRKRYLEQKMLNTADTDFETRRELQKEIIQIRKTLQSELPQLI